jgi:hypothetical protein
MAADAGILIAGIDLSSSESEDDEKGQATISNKLVQHVNEDKEQKRLQELWKTIKESGAEQEVLPDVKFVVKVRNRYLTDANSVYECNAW